MLSLPISKHFIATFIATLLSGTTAALAADGPACRDDNGALLASDCNAYLEQLYTSCLGANEVRETPKGACISVETFRRPLIGCDGDVCEGARPYPGYVLYPHTQASDVYRLEGEQNAETIVIFSQGGPADELLGFYLDYMEQELLIAYVAQTNFIKPGMLSSYNMTLAEARLEQDENISLIWESYQDLRTRHPDKRLVLAGHSMGAFLVQATLARHGNPFDGVVVMAGRLDVPFDFVYRFAIGENVLFPHIGDRDTYMKDNNITTLTPLGEYLVKGYVADAETVLLAAVGLPRYTELLVETDLSNLLYVYSDKDEQLGGLSSDEITFLENKGTRVVNAGWDDMALGHSRMLIYPEGLELITAFMKGK